MIHKVMRKLKEPNLSQRLQEWKRRIAGHLGVDSIYQSEAAELLDVPYKTYKNWEPTIRRNPGALALTELLRRLGRVEEYCRLNGSDDQRLNAVIKSIQERYAEAETRANSAA